MGSIRAKAGQMYLPHLGEHFMLQFKSHCLSTTSSYKMLGAGRDGRGKEGGGAPTTKGPAFHRLTSLTI